MYLVGFPLLLIPFAIYNIVAFLTPGIVWGDPLTRLVLPSGGEWTMSLGDMLVALSMLLLLVEVIKAYRTGGRYLMDHLLSILLLGAMVAEFYLVPRAATATLFLMIVASFADVVGGVVAMRRPRLRGEPPVVDAGKPAVPAEDIPAPPDVPAPASTVTPAAEVIAVDRRDPESPDKDAAGAAALTSPSATLSSPIDPAAEAPRAVVAEASDTAKPGDTAAPPISDLPKAELPVQRAPDR